MTDKYMPGIQGLEGDRRWPEKETVNKLATALAVPAERFFLPPTYVSRPSPFEALSTLAVDYGFEVVTTKSTRNPRKPKAK